MEMQRSAGVDGVSVVIPQCPKCEKKRAKGVMMVRQMDGRHIFKCDYCGQKRSIGWEEEQHQMMVAERDSNQKAVENRERYRREMDEKFNEELVDALENFKSIPDPVQNFYATEKPILD